MLPHPLRHMISMREAAQEAGLSRSRIHSWISCGKIGSAVVDGRRMVDRADLRQMLIERARKRPKPKLRLAVDNTR